MEFIKKNWLWILAIAIMIFMIYNPNDIKLKKKVNILEKTNDSIRQSIIAKDAQISVLNKSIDSSKIKIDSLSKEKQKVKTVRETILQQVNNLNPTQLDSIINSVPKKEAAQYIIGYPMVISELNIANNMLDSYRKQVSDLERRDSLRVAIIGSQKEIIKNVTEQRDLYKEAAKPKNGAFIYIQIPVNHYNSFQAGVDYQIRNKLLIGAGADYNKLTNDVGVNVKLGLNIF